MRRAIFIGGILLTMVLSACGTFQEVTVQENAGIAQAVSIGSIGVTLGDTAASGVFSTGAKLGEARYWSVSDDMTYGKFGVVHMNGLDKSGRKGALYTNYARDLWVEYLSGARDYNFQYASLKRGTGRMTSRNAAGEKAGAIGKIVPLDSVLSFGLFNNNTDPKTVKSVCNGKGIDTVLASSFDIRSSVVEMITPNQMSDAAGDFYVLVDVGIDWRMFDAATGKELFTGDTTRDDGYDLNVMQGKWIKLPVASGNMDAMNSYLTGPEFDTLIRQEIAFFLESELYKLLPHYRTYLEKVEE